MTPRWEWRTFGEDFGVAEAGIRSLGAPRTQASEEVYFLGPDPGANVKIRDAAMDVKLLRHVDGDGLEQWEPVLKSPFPLAAADVAIVLQALRVAAPVSVPQPLSREGLTGLLAGGPPGVKPVAVRKTRARFRGEGCDAELTLVVADGRTIRTLAVESEDPVRVLAMLRRLGLAGAPNVNYTRGLERLLGLAESGPAGAPRPRFAVIDVGTNSVKLHVAERLPAAGVAAAPGSTSEGGAGPGAGPGWKTLVDRAETSRLGDGLVAGGELQPAAIERTVGAIAGMADEARRLGVEALVAVGTMGLRSASNAAALLEAVRRRCGIEIEVVAGDEEGRLAYRAVQAGLGIPAAGRVVVFDTGGGSTQFTFGRGPAVEERFSLDVGAVRTTETWGLAGVVSPEQLARALAALSTAFARLDGARSPDALVGMGGAVTNLAAVRHGLVRYDPEVIQGSTLSLAEVDRQIEIYRALPAAARAGIPGLQPARADVILAGALIVRTILDELGRSDLVVSDRGLRHGVLLERFGASRAT